MQTYLPVNVGQCSHSKFKQNCGDWFDFKIPQGNELVEKGACFALACDGVHPKNILASVQTVVRSFLLDYYSTPKAWGVEESAKRVVRAINGWMNTQNQNVKEGDLTTHCGFCGLVYLDGIAYVIRVGNVPVFIYRHSESTLTVLNACLDRQLGESFLCMSEVLSFQLESGDTIVVANNALANVLNRDEILVHIQKRSDDLNHTAYAMVEQAEKKMPVNLLSVGLIEIR